MGASDAEVIAKAASEQRILVTVDRDFGALVFSQRVAIPAGVAYLRFVPSSPEDMVVVLLDIVERSAIPLAGSFTVVERDRVRQRVLTGEDERG
jgi:predicted nuclease of predicted toxin-antitoxin system